MDLGIIKPRLDPEKYKTVIKTIKLIDNQIKDKAFLSFEKKRLYQDPEIYKIIDE